MPIHRKVREAAVDPTDTDRIVAAYTRALMLLRFNIGDYQAAETVIAKKIVEIAQTDHRDATVVCTLALKELGLQID
jgi:hypothetical protein